MYKTQNELLEEFWGEGMTTEEKKLNKKLGDIKAQMALLEEEEKTTETRLAMLRQEEIIERKAERGW